MCTRRLVLRLRTPDGNMQSFATSGNQLNPAQIGQRRRRMREREENNVPVESGDGEELVSDANLSPARRSQRRRRQRERDALEDGRRVDQQHEREMRRPSPYRLVPNRRNEESHLGTSARHIDMENVANLTPAQRSQRRRRMREREPSERSDTGSEDSSGGEHHADIRLQSNHGRGSRTYRMACHMPLRNEVIQHYLGPFPLECPRCHAFHWLAEKRAASPKRNPEFAECCRGGEVALDFLEPIPQCLRALYEGRQRQAGEFRRNIRSYNKALAFTSTGGSGQLLGSSYDGRGPPIYKIQGEIYHRIGSILPDGDQHPVFSQMYIYDHHDALQYRMQTNPERDVATMEVLQRVMEECHPYVAVYQQAYQLCLTTSLTEYRIQLNFRKGMDRRRYNPPTANEELALIIPGDEDACANARDIILRPRGGPLIRISACHPAFLTLHFPLLAPTGQMSWHPDIPYVQSNRGRDREQTMISLCDFAKFRLHSRPSHVESNHFFLAEHLLQELIVHLWAAAEHSRLNWIRKHQDNLRAELYQGAVDALHEGIDAAAIGKKIILPSSFTSGPRFMHKNLQNALSLLRRFGGSDLFITFTANPQWREVNEALLPNQLPHHRPDIVARVFNLKFESMLDDIMQKKIFGKAVGFVYTVEYQKRGLPHIHLIVFLDRSSRLATPDAVDRVICTEFPKQNNNPELFELVKKFMVHGPCGVGFSSPCHDVRGKCSKQFPKQFRTHTEITGDSYVQTRRRDTGRFVPIGNGFVDNRSVISYSPYLLQRYNAHINVECTAGFHAVKYIYKYVYKGPDRASLTMHTLDGSDSVHIDHHAERDEIKLYLDARYISSSEAFARIVGWPTHREFPPLMQLPVHLEREQYVVFDRDHPDRLRNQTDTQLTGFFKANRQYPQARNTLYPDFPLKFTWDRSKKAWHPRKGGNTSGRLVFIPPTGGEKFYARLILSHVPDLRSFDDLRKYNGVTHSSIREACLARGLLAEDNELKETLQQGKHMMSGRNMRLLFISIVRDCEPSRPAELWELFKNDLCDDFPLFFRRRSMSNVTEEDMHDYGLHLLQQRLQLDDKTMAAVGLPNPTMDWNAILTQGQSLLDSTFSAEQQTHLLHDSLPKLNHEQRQAFDSILRSAQANAPHTFFLQGAAGAGKTFVYNTLCFAARSELMHVVCVASSGIAALLLPGGRTAHSTLKIPIELNAGSTCAISKRTALAEMIKKTRLLIWDECSMQHRHAFEAVNRTLQDIRDNLSLFGGIPTVLGGDFLQTLPVVTYGNKSDIINAALPSSPLWPYIEPNFHTLETNMRVGNNPEEQQYAKWLRRLAKGELNDAEDHVLIPNFLLCPSNTIDELICHTYPRIRQPHDMTYFEERCILAPRNRDANDINQIILDKFPGRCYDLWAIDQAFDPERETVVDDSYPSEVLHSAAPSGFPQAQLKLKIGCPVIVLRNMHSDIGVCNGSRGIVTQISTRVVEILLHNGDTCPLPRIKFKTADNRLPFHLHRLQFPLALSFAITINKSQGQSFSDVGIDLRVPAFAHGQVYVAFSRGRSKKNVKCILNDDTAPRTKNVVYREVLI